MPLFCSRCACSVCGLCVCVVCATPRISCPLTHHVQQAFGPIGEALGLDPEILACVADVRRIFHVLYFFDPLAPEHAADLAWFKASVEAVMDSFARLVARGHVTNYIHQIQKHAAPLLECGGLAPFANDTHETLQCLLKQAYHNFSSRGGQGLDKTLRLVCERWMMRLHVLVLAGYRHDSHIPGLTAQQRVVSSIPKLLSSPQSL